MVGWGNRYDTPQTETIMTTYAVYFGTEASYVVEVEADSLAEAIDKAMEKDDAEGDHGLCHQCARGLSLGDFEPSEEFTEVIK